MKKKMLCTAGHIHSGSICILCSVLGLLWPTKITTKSHAMPLAICVQTDMNQIFQMRHYTFILVKSLQKYQTPKLEVEEKSSTWPDSRPLCPGPGWPGGAWLTRQTFCSASNFNLLYFCWDLTKMNVWYLIWKMFENKEPCAWHYF